MQKYTEFLTKFNEWVSTLRRSLCILNYDGDINIKVYRIIQGIPKYVGRTSPSDRTFQNKKKVLINRSREVPVSKIQVTQVKILKMFFCEYVRNA